jgi:hypothetical protein
LLINYFKLQEEPEYAVLSTVLSVVQLVEFVPIDVAVESIIALYAAGTEVL